MDRVAQAAKRLLGDAQVVHFGSSASGRTTALSDIDILIVSAKVPGTARAKAELEVAIEELARLPPINPVEIHLATPEQAAIHPIYREVLGGVGKSRPRARRDS